ncbi:MAG: hypothetical protein M1834_004280 [Cirrosporium novae-zelandiae]|nr:MAG: hypothetical protein M1834_004280 [Cirrosporium novae-zelandiae]
MFTTATIASLSLFGLARAQQAGSSTTETHPTLNTQECDSDGTCTTLDTSVVLDSNWRWTYDSSSTNCYTGNEWDTTICTDPDTCATSCYLDGAAYEDTYGVTSTDDALTLSFVTEGTYSTNIGSRLYLMSNETNYKMFHLKNREFTFTVDVSNLPCGLNGALYFVDMDSDGGMSKYTNNDAGAKYGTGYCDAQCPHDIKFINGEANILNWTASTSDSNSGTGYYGSCCNEMDVWEANKISNAYTPHVCTISGQTRCCGTGCGDDSSDERYAGVCDKDGCDFNPYRMGNESFYGEGQTVDTSSEFTVVTQFVTDDGTDTGTLSEIRRIWIQDSVVIQNAVSSITGMDEYDSITDDFCEAQKTAFGDTDSFEARGGLSVMGDALDTGMVLVMSLWDDHAADMLWLDSDYPTDATATDPGVSRGTCATTSGDPDTVESTYPDASVTFSSIKFGPIGSTYSS